MKKIFGVAALIAGLLLASCGTIVRGAAVYSKNVPANTEMGYFFGTLPMYGQNGGILVLEYVNLDNNKDSVNIFFFDEKRYFSYNIYERLKKKEIEKGSLIIVPVKPGRYKLTNLKFIFEKNSLHSQKPVTLEAFSREILVQPGTLYYFGDWSGNFSSFRGVDSIRYNWSLLEVYDLFEPTKIIVQEEYPEFKDWGFETTIQKIIAPFNLMLFIEKVLSPVSDDNQKSVKLVSDEIEIILQPDLVFTWTDLKTGKKRIGRSTVSIDPKTKSAEHVYKFLKKLSDLSKDQFLKLEITDSNFDYVLIPVSNGTDFVEYEVKSPVNEKGKRIKFKIE